MVEVVQRNYSTAEQVGPLEQVKNVEAVATSMALHIDSPFPRPLGRTLLQRMTSMQACHYLALRLADNSFSIRVSFSEQ